MAASPAGKYRARLGAGGPPGKKPPPGSMGGPPGGPPNKAGAPGGGSGGGGGAAGKGGDTPSGKKDDSTVITSKKKADGSPATEATSKADEVRSITEGRSNKGGPASAAGRSGGGPATEHGKDPESASEVGTGTEVGPPDDGVEHHDDRALEKIKGARVGGEGGAVVIGKDHSKSRNEKMNRSVAKMGMWGIVFAACLLVFLALVNDADVLGNNDGSGKMIDYVLFFCMLFIVFRFLTTSAAVIVLGSVAIYHYMENLHYKGTPPPFGLHGHHARYFMGMFVGCFLFLRLTYYVNRTKARKRRLAGKHSPVAYDFKKAGGGAGGSASMATPAGSGSVGAGSVGAGSQSPASAKPGNPSRAPSGGPTPP